MLLYLNGGATTRVGRRKAQTHAGQQLFMRIRQGREGFEGLEDDKRASKWRIGRAKFLGDWEQICSRLAFLNVGAYPSKSFTDAPLLAALPSGRTTLDWAQNTLFPDAIAGKRVVVCMRAASFWGLRPSPTLLVSVRLRTLTDPLMNIFHPLDAGGQSRLSRWLARSMMAVDTPSIFCEPLTPCTRLAFHIASRKMRSWLIAACAVPCLS